MGDGVKEQYTPTPWVYDELRPASFYSDDVTGSIIGTCDGFRFAERPAAEQAANAAHIVKCVNAHDDLVAALSIFLGHDDRFKIAVGGNPNAVEKMMEAARAALAKAGAAP